MRIVPPNRFPLRRLPARLLLDAWWLADPLPPPPDPVTPMRRPRPATARQVHRDIAA